MRQILDKKFLVVLFLLVLSSSFFWWQINGIGEITDDSVFFHEVAASLAQNAAYNYQGAPSMMREPGYPFFIAVNYLIFGAHPQIIMLEQVILLFLTAAIIYILGKEIFNIFVGKFSGLAVAIYPIFSIFTARLLSEILAVFMVALFLFLFYLAGEKKSYLYYSLSAVALGFLILVKCAFALLAPLMVLAILINGIAWQQKIKHALIFSLLVFVILAPWLARNYFLFGEASFASRGGVLLYQRAIKTTYDGQQTSKLLISSFAGEYFVRRFMDPIYNFEKDGQGVRSVAAIRKEIKEKLGLTDYDKVDKIMKTEAVELIKKAPFKYLIIGFIELNNLNSPMIYYENHFSVFHDNIYYKTFLKSLIIISLRLTWFIFILLIIYGIHSIVKAKKNDAYALIFIIFGVNLPIFFLLGYPRFIMPILPLYFMIAIFAIKNIIKKIHEYSKRFDAC